MANLVNRVIVGTLALGILFVMFTNVVLPAFNDTYNAEIVGLNPATTQGMWTILILTVIVGYALAYLPKGIGRK